MQTWGSHGDIRPFLALAEGLQKFGHEVTLVITCVDHDRYKDTVSKAGVKIISVASPVIKDAKAFNEIGEAIVFEANPVTQAKNILTLAFEPALEEMAAASEQLCRDNDILIGHFFHYPLQAWAEKQHLPYVSVLLQHNFIPSAFTAPSGIPELGELGNRLSWLFVRLLLNGSMKEYPNRFRRQLGLPPVKDMIRDVWTSESLTLIGVSEQICQRQSDWPESHQVCGFLDMPNIDMEGSLGAELAAYLNAAEPPVYFTFGSLMPKDIEQQTAAIKLFREAARLANCRAIIQAPGWQACGFSNDEHIFYVTHAPHLKVFQRCTAIVHHGGSGTTQTASLSGKPSVIIAHIAEQQFWGNELKRAGLAASVLLRRKVTSRQLAQAIQQVLNSEFLQRQARNAGRAMRAENGVARAVGLINDTFSTIH